jgi:DNA-binding HxlR family transcriptional regulator
MTPKGEQQADGPKAAACCPLYHQAIELIGKRWTGAIVAVLVESGSPERGLRFSDLAHAVPQLSDRLLSERMKELEARGVVERTVRPGPPVRVEYRLTPMGRDLAPALAELKAWANRWLREERRAAQADAERAPAAAPASR